MNQFQDISENPECWLLFRSGSQDDGRLRARRPIVIIALAPSRRSHSGSAFASVRLRPAGHDRQSIDGLETGPLAPSDLGRIDRERQLRPALEQRLQRAPAFDPRELVAKAKMDSGAEGDMPVRPALQVEPLRM